MKAQPIVNDLSKRQWALVQYLELQNDYLSRAEIVKESGLYDNPVLNINERQYKGALRLLTHDLQKIKESKRYDKILITDRKGIKVAQTEEEVIDYFTREKNEILRRLERYYKQSHQYRDKDQYRAVFGKEKPLIEVLNKAKVEDLKDVLESKGY